MTRTLLALCLSLLLIACGSQPVSPAAGAACRPTDPGATTRLAMIRKLLDSDHPYAALAQLEAAGSTGPAADQLRADILRRLGKGGEARPLYQGLTATCLAGAGYHGLGLLAGQERRLGESLDYLRRARLALPADARVRSDLGYALLLAGDLAAARDEFMTAQDLAPEDRKAALNLVLLHYRQGDTAAAEALGKGYQAGTDELAALREEAARLAAEQGERR